MEIKLTKQNGMFSNYTHPSGPSLCTSAVRRVAEIPASAKVIYAVFSKTDVKPDASFTINPPVKGFLSSNSDMSTVKESRAAMMWGARNALGRAHKRGFRYVRFEY